MNATSLRVLTEFARQSNLIEGAPDEGPWLDDHVVAAAAVDACSLVSVLLPSRALHRMLFLRADWPHAGWYRETGVYVGDGFRVLYQCPPSALVEPLMAAWQRATIDLVYEGTGPFRDAWDVHHAFESIHPYLDGNGRVGRLHLNNVARALGHRWITPTARDRAAYYASIVRWREFRLAAFLDYADVSPWDGLDLPSQPAKSDE